jgi:hypothetical protein
MSKDRKVKDEDNDNDFVATKVEKTFDNDGNTQVADAKIIKIDDKLLFKKLQDKGGNIAKSSLKNKKMSDVLSKKDWKKNKMKD